MSCQTRTYQSRLQLTRMQSDLLDEYASLYCRIERTLFAETLSQGQKPESVKNQYLKRFSITARQFNAICRNLKGKVQSVKERRKGLIAESTQRIAKAEKVITKLAGRIHRAPNAVDVKKWRFQLHQKRRRLATMKQRHERMTADHQAGVVRLCFGSRKRFNQQFHLEKAGFSDHAQWQDAWQSARNSQFYVLGSKDENGGCQGCVATKTDAGYSLRLRLPDALAASGKLLEIPMRLRYGSDVLESALVGEQAISYRFLRDDRGWRVFITTSAKVIKPTTDWMLGAFGLDINARHLSVTETDRFGNKIRAFDLPLCTDGLSTDRASALIGDTVKTLVERIKPSGKPLVLEDLEFSKKKADLEYCDPKYARMLSAFAYQKIVSVIKSRCYDHGIEVKSVNPAYTSVIGKYKFMHRYGLSVHQAAALAIARRGLNCSEKPNRQDQLACSLPARNRKQHVWSFWRKVSRDRTVLAAHRSLFQKQSSLPLHAACDSTIFDGRDSHPLVRKNCSPDGMEYFSI